jgi:hypothetical protein
VVAVAILSLMAGAPEARACSECLCGTPFPADVLGGVVPMELRYGFEDRYLSKSNALEAEAGNEREREHRVAGFLLWRATNRVALLGRLPYNLKEVTETPLGEAAVTQRARGIGDAEVLALLGLTRGSATLPLVTGLVLGGTAPTGSNDLRNGSGERLDIHLQPGSGAWSGTAGLHLALATRGGALGMSVLGRLNGASAHGYRYGNVLLYNFEYSSPSRSGLQWVAEINGRSARRDRFEDGTLGENTGGAVIYAAPGVHWRSGYGLGIDAGVQIPVMESLFGQQEEHTTGRLAVSIER